MDDATRSDLKNQQEYKRLEAEIGRLENEKAKIVVYVNSAEEQKRKTEANIQEADKYVNNAEALETINARIKNMEQKIANTSSLIDENYTTPLFDESWILIHFEDIHHEFSRKVSELSSKKRELQTQFDKEEGIREGKKMMTAELLNNSIPLPTGVPSKAHMEEMLKDEICKVCNRPAKKGGDAYNFMLERLEEYLKSQKPEERETEPLFKNDYTNRLFNMGVSHEDNLAHLRNTQNKITEMFKFNQERKKELEELSQRLESEIEEREKVIGSSSIGAEKLSNVLKNYNGWQKDLTGLNKDIVDYQKQLQNIDDELKVIRDQKDNMDMKTANTFLIKTRAILRDIEKIFLDTRARKFDEFILLLEHKSNSIFWTINIESFTGKISFRKKMISGKISIEIEMQEENDRPVYKPNQSLLTSMYISILFAISEIAAELREEPFPLIFDAPTSSFGETKTSQFLNLLYETKNQKILLIKDFLTLDEKTNRLNIKEEFKKVKRNKAFWICLERPFEKMNLKTINTEVVSL